MIAATMRPGEAAVVFSYSGATKDSIHVAELAKHAGAKVICITHFAKSPLTAFADLVRCAVLKRGRFKAVRHQQRLASYSWWIFFAQSITGDIMMPAAKIMKKHPSLYWINCTRLGCPKAMKDDGFTRPQTNGQMHRKAESDHFLQPGRPISSEITEPPNLLFTSMESI